MRKYLTLTAILLAGSLLTLESCKRGENDPAISLVSRTNRLVGTWKLTQKQGSIVVNTTAGSVTTSESITSSYTDATQNGLEQTQYSQNTNAPVSKTFPYSFRITFEKTGDYTYDAVFYRPVTSNTSITQIYKGTGNWNWLDKGKDKLGLQLLNEGSISNLDTLNANTLLPYVITNEYYLDRLSSKDMTWKFFANDVTSIDTVTVANTVNFTFNFVKE